MVDEVQTLMRAVAITVLQALPKQDDKVLLIPKDRDYVSFPCLHGKRPSRFHTLHSVADRVMAVTGERKTVALRTDAEVLPEIILWIGECSVCHRIHWAMGEPK